jgi:FkbM family methyltransferase
MLLSFRLLQNKYNMKVNGIIHVGAHYGEEISDYIDCGVQDMIMFEPLEENFNILAEKVKDLNANIEGHQVALGSKPGKTTMYVSDNEKQSSSILNQRSSFTSS